MGNRGSSDPTVTPNLMDAVKSRDENKVKDLIAKKTNLSETDIAGNNALHLIAKEGHYKYPPAGIPKILIDAGIDVNQKNANGASALEISLLSGWQKVSIIATISVGDLTASHYLFPLVANYIERFSTVRTSTCHHILILENE